MDYTKEIFDRLQNGESVEDIAASLTKNLNEANEKHKAAEAAKREEAEAKAKQDNLFAQKVAAVEALIAALADLLAVYEVDDELVDAIEETNPEEIVKVIDESLPFLTKYIELNQELEALRDRGQKTGTVHIERISNDAVDPIENFLNKMVR